MHDFKDECSVDFAGAVVKNTISYRVSNVCFREVDKNYCMRSFKIKYKKLENHV